MTKTEFVTIEEAARRANCSVRHVYRLLAANDDKKTGKVRLGRRTVRIEWEHFEAAVRAGTRRS